MKAATLIASVIVALTQAQTFTVPLQRK